jgi:hypothetical protein
MPAEKRSSSPTTIRQVPNKNTSRTVQYAAARTSFTSRQALHVWDLRAVRERLRTIDLDWALPPLPDAVPGPTLVDMLEK